jgi:hypothetical protein
VQPGTTVRAIDYEVVSRDKAKTIGGLSVAAVEKYLGTLSKVAVLRCVDDHGEKLTAVGDARHLKELLDSGEASDPAGMKLRRQDFPVVIRGWLQAS